METLNFKEADFESRCSERRCVWGNAEFSPKLTFLTFYCA